MVGFLLTLNYDAWNHELKIHWFPFSSTTWTWTCMSAVRMPSLQNSNFVHADNLKLIVGLQVLHKTWIFKESICLNKTHIYHCLMDLTLTCSHTKPQRYRLVSPHTFILFVCISVTYTSLRSCYVIPTWIILGALEHILLLYVYCSKNNKENNSKTHTACYIKSE